MTFDPKETRALVERLRNSGCRSECEMHEDREDAADAITAALDEIEALREALKAMLDLQDNSSPFGGEMYQDRVDRVFDQCRAALKGEPT